MAVASQKHEQATNFRIRTDNHLASQNERGSQRAVKFGAVVIDGRIDGVQYSYFEDRAFGQGIQRVSRRGIKTRLQVEFKNRARSDANRRNGWIRTRSGTRKQTDETQNGSEGMAHGLGLSSSEKREQHK